MCLARDGEPRRAAAHRRDGQRTGWCVGLMLASAALGGTAVAARAGPAPTPNAASAAGGESVAGRSLWAMFLVRQDAAPDRPASQPSQEHPPAAPETPREMETQDVTTERKTMPEPPTEPAAASQPAGAPASAPAFVTSVTITGEQVEEIRLVRGKSAVIRTEVPIRRAAIASETIADILVFPQEVVLNALAFGTTQLTLWTTDERQKTYDVVVELDLPALNRAIKQLSPLATVTPRMMSDTLVLSGRVPDALTADRITSLASIVHSGRTLNLLDVGGVQQAVLRCTVAEVNRTASRELGMNWAIGGSDWSRDFFFANNVAAINPTIFGDSGLNNLILANPAGQLTYNRAATVVNPATTNLTFGFPKAEFQVFVNALRDNDLFRILAEPNVVAVNGQEASFLSGGEFPIAVAQGGATAGAISVEFRQFGIRLNFVPTILDNETIRMRVFAEVSDIIPAGTAAGLPVFTLSTRRVESTVEVGNGQTFAIGGLLSERVQAASTKIPGLGDLPVLGALFSSVQYQRNETELIVLVTPELVEPMDPHQVPRVPGADLLPPNDFELFALQRLEARRPAEEEETEPPTAPTRFEGSAGQWSGREDLSLVGPWGMSDFEEH